MRRAGSIKIGGGAVAWASTFFSCCSLATRRMAAPPPPLLHSGSARSRDAETRERFADGRMAHVLLNRGRRWCRSCRATAELGASECPGKSSGGFPSRFLCVSSPMRPCVVFCCGWKQKRLPLLSHWCFWCARSNAEYGFRSRWLGEWEDGRRHLRSDLF